MPAGVITQHLKMLGERRHLGVPHSQIGAQRVGQHQYRRALRAIQAVVEFTFSKLYTSHELLL